MKDNMSYKEKNTVEESEVLGSSLRLCHSLKHIGQTTKFYT